MFALFILTVLELVVNFIDVTLLMFVYGICRNAKSNFVHCGDTIGSDNVLASWKVLTLKKEKKFALESLIFF